MGFLIQETVQERWEDSARGYSQGIQKDFDPPMVRIWQELILDEGADRPLDILDVGTGPGYFATVLSMAGHRVTAIDCAENMLEEARKNAAAHGTAPEFLQMDSHCLKFADQSFDLIVSRNVTWTLYDPKQAYGEWRRVLRQKGKLVVFDANWHLHKFDPQRYDRVMGKSQEQKPPECAYQGDNPQVLEYYRNMPLARLERPQWDQRALPEWGFQVLLVRPCLNQWVYSDQDQELYRDIPLFQIVAEKTEQVPKGN